MQLAVKAGSIDEEDDQQGLAHFLEHMAFNGTRHFKAGELIATLESTGARMGPHVNAYTVVRRDGLHVRAPDQPRGDRREGAAGAGRFRRRHAARRRPRSTRSAALSIEEWRGGLGAGSRLRDQQIPVLYYQSKYAERLPIGKPEILKAFTPDRLRAFYTKWYRPDRMAVVVVGDLDPAKMEALVKAEFGAAREAGRRAAPTASYPVPLPCGGALQGCDGPGGDAVLGVARPEAPAPAAGSRRGLPPQPRQPARVPDAERPVRRAVAEAGRAVPERRRLRRRPVADGGDRVARRRRAGRQDRGRPRRAGASRRSASSSTGSAPPSSIAPRSGRWPATTARTPSATRPRAARYVQEYVNHFLEGEPSPGIAYEHQLAHEGYPGDHAGAT